MHRLPDLRLPARKQRFTPSWVALLCGLLLALLVVAPVLAAPPNGTAITATTNEDTSISINVNNPNVGLFTLNLTTLTPAHGSASIFDGTTLIYTPGANQVTQVTFGYLFCEGNLCGNAGTVTVNITPVNDDPTAVDDTATTTEDTSVTIAVLTNDSTGPANENQIKTLVSAQGALNGTTSVVGSSVAYTPNANYCGTDSFTYRMSDGVSTDDATVTVTITCVNDAPTAVNDTFTMNEDTTATLDVLANDSAGPANENQAKTLVSVQNAVNGTAVINGSDVNFTPTPNFCGQASFSYTMRDDSNVTRTASAIITVTCLPEVPTLSLSAPYGVVGHTFLVDVRLTSVDTPVSGVEFKVNYPVCLTDPDVPSNNSLADDVTSTLSGNDFYYAVADTSGPALHFVIATIKTPAVSIAGATRTIGTMKFLLPPSCSGSLTFSNPIFIDLNGTEIPNGQTTPYTGALSANQAPSDIALSSLIVSNGGNSVSISGTDPDGDTPLTFDLVSGFGDNNKFVVNSGTLALVAPTSGQQLYSVRLRATDPYGATYEEAFSIRYNQLPTDISLSNATVAEGVLGATVGTLSTTDPDSSDAHTYALVSGVGDADNGNFEILGTTLKLKPNRLVTFPTIYSVRISTTDPYGGTYAEPFTISATQLNLRPDANDDGVPTPVLVDLADGSPKNILVLANDFDPDGGSVTVQSVTNGARGTTTNLSSSVDYAPSSSTYNGPDSFTYTITDNDSPAQTDSASVSLIVVADVAPGDCDASGSVNVADIMLIARELFDNAGQPWYMTYAGTYAGSPNGCDATNNKQINLNDITCAAALIFGRSCVVETTAATKLAPATLAVGAGLEAQRGATVRVPILLDSGGNAATAASFALNFSADQLSFDTTDADQDGVYDAVELNTDAEIFKAVFYNAEANRLEFVLADISDPFLTLADGEIAAVTLTVNAEATANEVALTLSHHELSTDASQLIPVEVTNGTVSIAAPEGTNANRFFMPLIFK